MYETIHQVLTDHRLIIGEYYGNTCSCGRFSGWADDGYYSHLATVITANIQTHNLLIGDTND